MVQVGKAVFVKESCTTLGIEPRTNSYPGRLVNHTSVCWVKKNWWPFKDIKYDTHASSVHHQRIISAPPVHHQFITSTSCELSVHHQCNISTSSVHHYCIISASSVHYQCIIGASTVHHQRITRPRQRRLQSRGPRTCILVSNAQNPFCATDQIIAQSRIFQLRKEHRKHELELGQKILGLNQVEKQKINIQEKKKKAMNLCWTVSVHKHCQRHNGPRVLSL